MKGSGNSLDYGARMYDSRLGRFFKMDRYYRDINYKSPYVYADNTPIWASDKNGDWAVFFITNGQKW